MPSNVVFIILDMASLSQILCFLARSKSRTSVQGPVGGPSEELARLGDLYAVEDAIRDLVSIA